MMRTTYFQVLNRKGAVTVCTPDFPEIGFLYGFYVRAFSRCTMPDTMLFSSMPPISNK